MSDIFTPTKIGQEPILPEVIEDPAFIAQEIQLEGGSKETNDPSDSGGRTKYGISEKAHPEAWADGDVTEQEATRIYQKEYLDACGISTIPDTSLTHQVANFGITSGPETSVRILQQLLHVTVDGKIGPKTVASIRAYPSGVLFGQQVSGLAMLNLAFRDAITLYYITQAKKYPKNLKYILGWVSRLQEFK